jgi:transcriptional regulator with XRE-family HTH domain
VEQFGNRLRTARKDRGLTLEQLAAVCNTSETVLRNYEKARKSPNVEMLLRVCEALKVSPDYLLQDELSFNPYEDKLELYEAMGCLGPASLNLLRDFLLSLHVNASDE